LIDFIAKDSIDFEQNLEPMRPEFERRARKFGEKRINPVTRVSIIHSKEEFIHLDTGL
jgi:hypothetical protein